MRKFALRSFVFAVASLILSCATTHEVSLGGSQDCPAGQMCAGRGDVLVSGERAATGFRANSATSDVVQQHPAWALVQHLRTDPKTGKKVILGSDFVKNVKTTAGIDFLFTQGYSTSTGANGLNYIGCSNDTLTETTASTTLSNEIAANGISRHSGTYAHTAAASTATISYTFTCATASQAVQKCALFTAASNGTMTHVLGFTQRTLQVGDQLAVTFTITLSADDAEYLKTYQHFAVLDIVPATSDEEDLPLAA